MPRVVSLLKIGIRYSLSVNLKRIPIKREEQTIKIPWLIPKTMRITREQFRKHK
jgi:hypothetical protein